MERITERETQTERDKREREREREREGDTHRGHTEKISEIEGERQR